MKVHLIDQRSDKLRTHCGIVVHPHTVGVKLSGWTQKATCKTCIKLRKSQ